jgi:hypothetical protein
MPKTNATVLRHRHLDLDLTTKNPITSDSWYEHTDGSYGFYVGAAGRGGAKLIRHVATAAECVDLDPDGSLISVGWPAMSDYGTYDDHGNWNQTRETVSSDRCPQHGDSAGRCIAERNAAQLAKALGGVPRTAPKEASEAWATGHRVFRGAETSQVDRDGAPAERNRWYFEPVGYDGTVLWSHAYETQYAAAAVSAAMRATELTGSVS